MRGLPRFRASKPQKPLPVLTGMGFWVSSFVERVLRLFGGILLSGVLGFHALQRTSFLCGLDVRRHLFGESIGHQLLLRSVAAKLLVFLDSDVVGLEMHGRNGLHLPAADQIYLKYPHQKYHAYKNKSAGC